jgi:hypothetical protein
MFVSEIDSMKCAKVQTLLLYFASVAFLFILMPSAAAQEKSNPKPAPANPSQIVVRGKVYCLDESGHRLGVKQDCSKGAHLYEIVAADKKVYRFSPDDVLTSMFKESTVRQLDFK